MIIFQMSSKMTTTEMHEAQQAIEEGFREGRLILTSDIKVLVFDKNDNLLYVTKQD